MNSTLPIKLMYLGFQPLTCCRGLRVMLSKEAGITHLVNCSVMYVGGEAPSWPSLTAYDIFKWQYKTFWHLFISAVRVCDSFTQNSLPELSFLIYFHCSWNAPFRASSPLFMRPPRDWVLALQYSSIWALGQNHSGCKGEVCSSPAFQKHR